MLGERIGLLERWVADRLENPVGHAQQLVDGDSARYQTCEFAVSSWYASSSFRFI